MSEREEAEAALNGSGYGDDFEEEEIGVGDQEEDAVLSRPPSTTKGCLQAALGEIMRVAGASFGVTGQEADETIGESPAEGQGAGTEGRDGLDLDCSPSRRGDAAAAAGGELPEVEGHEVKVPEHEDAARGKKEEENDGEQERGGDHMHSRGGAGYYDDPSSDNGGRAGIIAVEEAAPQSEAHGGPKLSGKGGRAESLAGFGADAESSHPPAPAVVVSREAGEEAGEEGSALSVESGGGDGCSSLSPGIKDQPQTRNRVLAALPGDALEAERETSDPPRDESEKEVRASLSRLMRESVRVNVEVSPESTTPASSESISPASSSLPT